MDEIKKQIAELNARLDRLDNSTTISIETENAFRERLKIGEFAQLAPSSKSASSENQVVNEAGVATYSVLKPPDGFEQRVVGGVIRYYAYWN